MDSLSQLALGSAVGIAVMGKRTAVWKAALWGGVAGTLPDLDVLMDFGDAVRNMIYHRSWSHSVFMLTLLAPIMAASIAWLHRERPLFKWWLLAMWLALVTHPLLDFFTIYGTQLFLPLTNYPYGMGSMFIIDPLYTLPLLVGILVALLRREHRGVNWARASLVVSCVYLAWSVGVQAHVQERARVQLVAQGLKEPKLFATPSPFNTVLWRIVVRQDTYYLEGFYSLMDGGRPIRFTRFEHDQKLYTQLQDQWPVQQMARFTKGFFKINERVIDGKPAVVLSDLRMGQEPNFVFMFKLAQSSSAGGARQWQEVTPQGVGGRGNPSEGLKWLRQRIMGVDVDPPR